MNMEPISYGKGGRLTSAFFYYRSKGFESSGAANGFSLLMWS